MTNSRRLPPALTLAALLLCVPATSVGTSGVFGVHIAIVSECTARPVVVTKGVAITCQPGTTPYQKEVYQIDEEGERPIDSPIDGPVPEREESPRVPFTFNTVRPMMILPYETDVGADRYTGRVVYVTF
jgi:hypothetical protein